MASIKSIVGGLLIAILSLVILVGQPDFHKEVPNWHGYVVAMVMLIAVILMIHNYPAAMCMLGVDIIFVVLKIIKPQDFFAGFASDAAIATGVMIIFADGVYQSSVLDVVTGPLLPTNISLFEARLRIMLMGMMFSVFLNNTPVMAILLPVTEAFAARAGYPLRSLLMPLSFSIFLGATCSKIGSSCNLTAMASIKAAIDADLGPGVWGTDAYRAPEFFSPGLIGFPTAIAGLFFMSMFTRTILPDAMEGDDAPAASIEDPKADPDLPAAHELMEQPGQPLQSKSNYLINFRVTGVMAGKPLSTTGLDNASAAITLKQIVVTNTKNGAGIVKTKADWQDHIVSEDDMFLFSCTAAGLAQLRRRRGMKLISDGADNLGNGRRSRMLFECVVGQASPWVGNAISGKQISQALKGKGAVLAIRQAESPSVGEGEDKYLLSQASDASDDENTKMVPAKQRLFVLEPGSLLLVEAWSDFLKSYPTNHFPMVSSVPGSKPPRTSTAKDKMRMLAVGSVLIGVVLLAACNLLSLSISGFVALFVLIGLEVMTFQECFKALEGPNLLIIACASGIGKAIGNTGLGEALGKMFVTISFDNFALLLIWFFIMLSVMGCFLNANALVSLVMPIAYAASKSAQIGFRPLFYLTMYMASISSFNIPVARATNLMIVRRAPYNFGDFAKYGLALQFFIAIPMLTLLYLFEKGALWDHFNVICNSYGNMC